VSAEVDEDSSVLCSPRAVPPTEAGGQEQARHDRAGSTPTCDVGSRINYL
jgi:hypothetical protein